MTAVASWSQLVFVCCGCGYTLVTRITIMGYKWMMLADAAVVIGYAEGTAAQKRCGGMCSEKD
jgi:hypothetical protein